MAHAVIAHLFHYTPEILWNMTEKELIYWLERAEQAREFFKDG
jgi:hypothetical protein